MQRVAVVKFGGSAIGPAGTHIGTILSRMGQLLENSKVVAVFSAPLAAQDGKNRSLTDIVLEQGRKAESGAKPDMSAVAATYQEILKHVAPESRDKLQKTVSIFLKRVEDALSACVGGEFADERRSEALGYSGELLMAEVMCNIFKDNDIRAATIPFEEWPIITDTNIESTNFLLSESHEALSHTETLLSGNEVVCIGGFIGRTKDGRMTTYERGGSDRTAADMGILLHKKYDARIDLEKDSSVVSADPKTVSDGLEDVPVLSYNEARFAGMFGMKILDPIAVKEILENGVDIPIIITDMHNPQKTTIITRTPKDDGQYPLKIVTGKGNCAIIRMEHDAAQKLIASLNRDRRYNEYIILSPFTKDGTEFTRMLMLDADYVKRNIKYILEFDALASITYNRGVVTLIGDQLWRARHVVSRASSLMDETGINILNMDAQEETSRIIIVMDDAKDNVPASVRAIHTQIRLL